MLQKVKLLTNQNQDWLVVFRPTPLKNDGQLVSWDDEIPNMMGKSLKKCEAG